MGYVCVCGEALPSGETCPCQMAYDEVYAHGDEERTKLRPATKWSGDLEKDMLCHRCGVRVSWPLAERTDTHFTCPACGHERPHRSARPAVRKRAGVRDSWMCHRCGLPVDPALEWPHPLFGVGDHHPVSRLHGGPPTLANIKIAHSLCNGSHYNYTAVVRPDLLSWNRPDPEQPMHGEPRGGEATQKITDEQQAQIDEIFKVAERGDGFPLPSRSSDHDPSSCSYSSL
jgi:hypothetical protein